MRAFLAVELPAEIRSHLARLHTQLAEARADVNPAPASHRHRSVGFDTAGSTASDRLPRHRSRGGVKWTEEENLHVTMRFLGDITEAQRRGVEETLQGVASRHRTTTVQLTGLGAFPSMASPRVLWVGIGEGKDALTTIAGEIEQGVVSLGFPKADHPFGAHVTLGRVRSPKHRAQLVETMRQAAWESPEPFTATHLTLFQSTLTPSGPCYTVLARFPLQDGCRHVGNGRKALKALLEERTKDREREDR